MGFITRSDLTADQEWLAQTGASAYVIDDLSASSGTGRGMFTLSLGRGKWRNQIDTVNLVGYVSHDGIYPTGAVIERGSASNREHTAIYRWDASLRDYLGNAHLRPDLAAVRSCPPV